MIGQEQRLLFTQDNKILSREAPIAALNVTATTSGGAQALHVVPEGQAVIVSKLVACNVTASPATLTLHVVPSGGSIGPVTASLVGYTIAANTAVNLTDIIGGLWQSEQTVRVWSGTSAAITLSGYYRQVF